MTELHPDLVPYLEENERLGTILRHPIVYAVPYFESLNDFINAQYEHKSMAIREARQNGDHSTYINLHEKPYRLLALQVVMKKCSHKDAAEYVRDVWMGSENIWQCYSEWNAILREYEGTDWLMERDEIDALYVMPDTLAIYRGTKYPDNPGLSYSLELSRAQWFSERFGAEGKVITRYVNKKDIVAYFTSRGEEEIVVLPHAVRSKLSMEVYA